MTPRWAEAAASRLRPCPTFSRTGAEEGRSGAGGLRTCLRGAAGARGWGRWEERPREPLIWSAWARKVVAGVRGASIRHQARWLARGQPPRRTRWARPERSSRPGLHPATRAWPCGPFRRSRFSHRIVILQPFQGNARPANVPRRRLDDIPVQRSPRWRSRPSARRRSPRGQLPGDPCPSRAAVISAHPRPGVEWRPASVPRRSRHAPRHDDLRRAALAPVPRPSPAGGPP